MGVCLARCTRCERLHRVTVYQERGKRLRHQRSPCCHARYTRARHHKPGHVERP